MSDYISQVKIGNVVYDVKAKALTDEVIADLKKSAMTYKGPITQSELDKLTNPSNGDVYTVTDKENKEVVWYKGPNDTTGKWADIGYDDAHAHSVTINNTEKSFDSNGKLKFTIAPSFKANSTLVYQDIKSPGSITDPQHNHAITGKPSFTTGTTNIGVKNPGTGEMANYTPTGTISDLSMTDYVSGINRISFTPSGSVSGVTGTVKEATIPDGYSGSLYSPKGTNTGGAASIPANTVITGISVSHDAIKSVRVAPNANFDDLKLVNGVTANETSVIVSGNIAANTYYTSLTTNTAKDISLTGTKATITSDSYTPSGTVTRSAKIIAKVEDETLVLESAIQEATGAFSGTSATIKSSYTPAGKITIPASTFVTGGTKNSVTTISSAGKVTPSISVSRSTPYADGASTDSGAVSIFNVATDKATVAVTGAKNSSVISCNFTNPKFSGTNALLTMEGGSGTFSGTVVNITPTLTKTTKTLTPTFTGTGVIMSYSAVTDVAAGTLAVGKSSTGITHTDPTFDQTEVLSEVVSHNITVS